MPSYITERMIEAERQAEIDAVAETDLILDQLERWLEWCDEPTDYEV